MIYKKHNMNYTPSKGFTLVETLVAITILLLVVTGPITIAQKGIQSAYYANDQQTAIFLAQEGIESIKRLRDENGIETIHNGTDSWEWHGNLESSCKSSNGCDLSIGTNGGEEQVNEYIPCTPASDCKLNVYEADGGSSNKTIYSHSTGAGWDPSPFTRVITLENLTAEEVAVTVSVSWINTNLFGGQERTIQLRTVLYDQYKRFE